MFEREDHSTAISMLAQDVSFTLSHADIYNQQGLHWMDMGQYHEALKYFSLAIGRGPKIACLHYNMGLAQKALGHVQAAGRSFLNALKYDPNYAKAHFSLGDLLLSARKFDIAEKHFRRAIEINSAYVAAYNHLAHCLGEQGRLKEAQRLLIKALQINPESAQTQCNFGNLARQCHEFDKAIRHYREAIRLQPDFIEAHFNLSLVLLLLENFKYGWNEYEWRLRFFPKDSGYPNRFGLPLWRGQSLLGKAILVYDEQGFGDVFMACRYLLTLKRLGARLVFETRPELFDLFTPMSYIDETILRTQNRPPSIPCDYCTPLLSLPGIFNLNRQTIRFEKPYLCSNKKLAAHWSNKMTSDLVKIGLVWQGSAADRNRRCGIDKLKALYGLRGIKWYGLQKDLSYCSKDNTNWIVQLGPGLRNFADTAAVISNLDLVISIDTSVAHLAGAMGKRVWVLLPYVPDWRWFLNDTATPWYGSMRLFRQSKMGDWDSVIQFVRKAIEKEFCGVEK